MNKLVVSMLSATLLIASLQTRAAARLSPATADEVLQKSGLVMQLGQIGPSVLAGLNLNPALSGRITEAQLDSIRTAMGSAFAADRLTADAKQQLIEVLPSDTAAQALVWLNSDLGRRIAVLEDVAGQAEGFGDREAAAAEAFKRLPERRVERYIHLAKATMAGEGGATIAIDTTLATARGVASLASDSPDANLEAIRKQLDENRPKLVESMEQEFTVLFAGAYATLEDKDIDQYIAFSESPAGTAYNKALIKVMDTVMVHASIEAGKQLAQARREAAPKGT